MTTATINGGSGLFAMNALCQAEFGAGARLASIDEYWTSTRTAPVLQRAWLNPVERRDGLSSSNSNNCETWQPNSIGSSGSSGLTVMPIGWLEMSACEIEHGVACAR